MNIAVILIFLFVWSLVTAILFKLFYKEKSIDKLKYFDEGYIMKEKFKNDKKIKISIFKQLSSLIPISRFNQKHTKKIENDLIRADIPITFEELFVIKLLSSSAFAFLGFAVSKDLFILILIFILIWNTPSFIISSRKKEKIKMFDGQLSEGMIIISNSLKAGYSFLQAISVVCEEMKDPFSKEFKKLLKDMSFGIQEGEALRNLLTRIESEDLRLIINAILIQKDTGGNLSEILENIGETIRERQKIKNEVKTLTAQGRLSGLVVMIMPVFLGLIIYLFNKEYMLLLFTTSMGRTMLILAVISEILGFFMIRKITNIEM